MNAEVRPLALVTGAPGRIKTEVPRRPRACGPRARRVSDESFFPSSILAQTVRIIREWRDTFRSQVPEVRWQQEDEAMAWSTRELAELARTTVNTIRHYHHLGLLAEPERRDNGYKQYGEKHLIRLLRIRRLARLGVPLSHIRDDDIDGLNTQETLRQLDTELVASIQRLQQVRSDIAASQCDDAPGDAPAGLESAASFLSESNRSILHISGQICDEQAVSSLQYMMEVDARVGRAIDTLPPDADDAARDRLAQLLAPILVQNLIRCPWLVKSTKQLSWSERVTQQTISEAVTRLYNPAQLDVIGRAIRLVQKLLEANPRPRYDGH